MYNTKIKFMLVLFLFLEIQTSYGMPQGFFSNRFSIPKVASWNSNDRSLTLLPNVRVESPIKNSFINIFGKKNTIDNNVSKKEPIPINVDKIGQTNEGLKADQNVLTGIGSIPVTTNYERKSSESNYNQDVRFTNVNSSGQGLTNKFNSINENSTADNHIGDITTESLTETTTYEYETTTFYEELFNRASPQLVASLLG